MPVSIVFAVLVDGWDWCDDLNLPYESRLRGVVISLLGSGGTPGLSGASVDGEKGGGDRLPCLLFLWFRGIAAADLTLRMLFAR
jgi:hypothetical protein